MAVKVVPQITFPKLSTHNYGEAWGLIERDDDADYYIIDSEMILGVAVYSPFTREFEERMVGPRNWVLTL